uniref:Peptidase A2 domain-containing protein n=1 Tax=Amphimedon queenslandica TaxID=400682 RepID=A0A1X7VES6_AMPQE
MLRDRIICGVNDKAMQKRLLSEADLSLDNMVKVAQAVERAAKNAMTMSSGSSIGASRTKDVHKTDCEHKRSHRRDGVTTDVDKNHLASLCCFNKAKFHGFYKIGHIKKACRNTKGTPPVKHKPVIKHIVDNANEEEPAQEYDIFQVQKRTQLVNPLMVIIEVEGSEIMVEVDTGASVSSVFERTYDKYWPNNTLWKSAVTLRTYSKETLRTLDQVLEEQQSLLKERLGTLTGYEAFLQVDESAKAKYCKARSVPYAI